jgi:hypothetical protein
VRRFLGIAALMAVLPASGAFKCVDEHGKTHFGDSPPPACANVVMYEVSPAGSVIRKIEPTAATPKASDAEKKKAADKEAAATRLRDRVLLDTYSTDREIDIARDRNVELIKSRMGAVQIRIGQLEKREKELGTRAPAADIEAVKKEKSHLIEVQERYNKDLEATKARFDADKKRWIELRAAMK